VSRKKLIKTNEFPYHVGARVNNREHFPCGLPAAWKVLSAELHLQAILHDLKIHAFVMMPNHFHLLVTTPEAPISDVAKAFLSSATRIMNVMSGRTGRVFGARYHWTAVQNPLYYVHAIKYIYRNPVKAGLADEVGGYAYSSFAGLTGRAPLPFAVLSPVNRLDCLVSGLSPTELEAWLNQPYKTEDAEGIKKAFRRREFKLPLDRKTRRPLGIATEI
jgi:REP element-mobilizing transposase RayT